MLLALLQLGGFVCVLFFLLQPQDSCRLPSPAPVPQVEKGAFFLQSKPVVSGREALPTPHPHLEEDEVRKSSGLHAPHSVLLGGRPPPVGVEDLLCLHPHLLGSARTGGARYPVPAWVQEALSSRPLCSQGPTASVRSEDEWESRFMSGLSAVSPL